MADDKDVVFLASTLDDLRGFPDAARRELGYQLNRVQQGLDPTDWKPMSAVGSGVREIRIRSDGAYRVIYVASFMKAIYVLYAFEKKSQKTPGRVIEIARRRFQALIKAGS